MRKHGPTWQCLPSDNLERGDSGCKRCCLSPNRTFLYHNPRVRNRRRRAAPTKAAQWRTMALRLPPPRTALRATPEATQQYSHLRKVGAGPVGLGDVRPAMTLDAGETRCAGQAPQEAGRRTPAAGTLRGRPRHGGDHGSVPSNWFASLSTRSSCACGTRNLTAILARFPAGLHKKPTLAAEVHSMAEVCGAGQGFAVAAHDRSARRRTYAARRPSLERLKASGNRRRATYPWCGCGGHPDRLCGKRQALTGGLERGLPDYSSGPQPLLRCPTDSHVNAASVHRIIHLLHHQDTVVRPIINNQCSCCA